MVVVGTAATDAAERDYTAAVVAAEWIAEVLSESTPDWWTVAALANELRKLAAGRLPE